MGRNQPQVSAFPTATGFSSNGSPGKDGSPVNSSNLAQAELGVDDLMED
jgi:hypothetical protein